MSQEYEYKGKARYICVAPFKQKAVYYVRHRLKWKTRRWNEMKWNKNRLRLKWKTRGWNEMKWNKKSHRQRNKGYSVVSKS